MKKVQGRAGEVLAAIPLSPNQWTVLSILIAFAGGLMIALYNEFTIGILLFVLAFFSDMIDGAVARARGQTTKLGGFLDGVADRTTEAIMLFSFMFYPLPTVFIDSKIWLASVIFLGTCMPAFVRAYSDHKEILTKEEASALGGICERSERLLILGLGAVGALLYSTEFIVYSLILISLLSAVTIVQRLTAIMRSA